MMGRPTGCSIHRAALTAFAERAERGPGIGPAFDHLDGCRRCQADLTEILLTVHAVERTLGAVGSVEPPADAWDRLRGRVQRPVANVWAARTSLAGVLVGAGLVAALIGPTAVVRPGESNGREPGPGPAALQARTVADQRAEAAFLSRPRPERPQPRSAVPEVEPTAAWSGPDGLGRTAQPVRTDVPAERAD